MSVTRKGNPDFDLGLDTLGRKSWRSNGRRTQDKGVLARLGAKVMEPVHALAGEVSLLSHYANDFMMRLSLKVDEMMEEAGLDAANLEELKKAKWASNARGDVRKVMQRNESKTLRSLEKFAS